MSDNSKPTKIGILVLALAAFAKAGDLQQPQLTSTNSPSCQKCNGGSSNDHEQEHSTHDHENNNENNDNDWRNNNKGHHRWRGNKVLNNFFPVVTPVIPPYTPGYGYQPQIGAGGPQYWGFYGSELATSQYPVAVPRVYTTAPQLVPVSGLTTPPATQNDQASQVLPIYEDQDDSSFIPDIRTAIPVSAPDTFYQSRPELTTQRLTITPLKGQANQVFVVKQSSQPTVIVAKDNQFSVTSDPVQQPINQASQSYAPNSDQRNININLNLNGQSLGKNTKVSFNSGSINPTSAPVVPQAQVPQAPSAQSASSYYLSSPDIVQETSYVPPATNAPPSATTYTPKTVAQENQATSYVPTGYKPATSDVKYPSNDSGYLPKQQTQTQSVSTVSYNIRKNTADLSTGSANPNS